MHQTCWPPPGSERTGEKVVKEGGKAGPASPDPVYCGSVAPLTSPGGGSWRQGGGPELSVSAGLT